MSTEDFDLGTALRQLQRTVPQMARLAPAIKNASLLAMAEQLGNQADSILEANTLDLEGTRGQSLPEWVLEGMKLTPERLARAAQQLQLLASLPDPIGTIDRSWRLENNLLLNRYRAPLGVLAVIYEIYPEFAITAWGMALKTGNSLVLCSSDTLAHTHEAMVRLLSGVAYDSGVPEGSLESMPIGRLQSESVEVAQVTPLLQSRYVDLVIPCGRPNWVEFIQRCSMAPVLITQLGHGHLYLDASATWAQVQSVLLNNLRSSDPEVSNGQRLFSSQRMPQAIPLWLLIHQDWGERYLSRLIADLSQRDCLLQAGPLIRQRFPNLLPITEAIDSAEQIALRLEQVKDLSEATALINKHAHRHSEAIITDSQSATQRFIREVDAAMVYINSSPLPQWTGIPTISHPFGVALGTSIQKLQVRGPIDLESLTTVKYVAQGSSTKGSISESD